MVVPASVANSGASVSLNSMKVVSIAIGPDVSHQSKTDQ